MTDGQPVGVHDLVEDVCLDLVVDPQFQLCADPAEDIVEYQREQRAGNHDDDQIRQLLRLVSCDDVDQILADDACRQSQSRTEDTQDRIENDGSLVPFGIGKDPLPVIDDFFESAFLVAFVQDA